MPEFTELDELQSQLLWCKHCRDITEHQEIKPKNRNPYTYYGPRTYVCLNGHRRRAALVSGVGGGSANKWKRDGLEGATA